MRIERLLPGDLIFGLVRSHVGLHLADTIQVPYSHVMVVLDGNRYVEAAPGGVRIREFSEDWRARYVHLDVFRFHAPERDLDAFNQRVCAALESVSDVPFYGVSKTAGLIIWTWLRVRFLRRKIASVGLPRVSPTGVVRSTTCASLVSWALAVGAEHFPEVLSVRRGLPICLRLHLGNRRAFWAEMYVQWRRIARQSQFDLPVQAIDPQTIWIASQARQEFLQARGEWISAAPPSGNLNRGDCMPCDLLASAHLEWKGSLADFRIRETDVSSNCPSVEAA
jgi:hypothetical protein